MTCPELMFSVFSYPISILTGVGIFWVVFRRIAHGIAYPTYLALTIAYRILSKWKIPGARWVKPRIPKKRAHRAAMHGFAITATVAGFLWVVMQLRVLGMDFYPKLLEESKPVHFSALQVIAVAAILVIGRFAEEDKDADIEKYEMFRIPGV